MSKPDESTKPAFPWVAVFVVLALVLPITLFCIACCLKPSIRKYRPYARKCHATNPTVVAGENIRLSHNEKRDWSLHVGKNRTSRCWTTDATRGIWTRTLRSLLRRRSASGDTASRNYLAEKGIQSWDAQENRGRRVVVSGAKTAEQDTRDTVRRRRTESTVKSRTSAYLESMATTAVEKLIFGGTGKFEDLKNATKDIEAQFDACDDKLDVTLSRRASSMPSMHIKSQSSQEQDADVASRKAPSFTRIFEPPNGDGAKSKLVESFQSVSWKTRNANQTNSSDLYSLSIFDEYETAIGQSEVGNDARSAFSFERSVRSFTDTRRDEAADRGPLEGYEARSVIDDSSSLRDITNSTMSSLNVAHNYPGPLTLPDYSMKGYYDQPIAIHRVGDNAWQLASQNLTPSSQRYYTARSLAREDRNLKTPRQRFPLRKPRFTHSVPRTLNPYTTFDGANDTLYVPRKRPTGRATGDLYLPFALDGSPEQPPSDHQQEEENEKEIPVEGKSDKEKGKHKNFTIDDLPSSGALKRTAASNPFLRLSLRPTSPQRPTDEHIRYAATNKDDTARPAGSQGRRQSRVPHTPTRSFSAAENLDSAQASAKKRPEITASSADDILATIDTALRRQNSLPRTPTRVFTATKTLTSGHSPPGPRSASPCSIRYMSLPRTAAEFKAQKRKFSGPADFERSQRRLRRAKGRVRDAMLGGRLWSEHSEGGSRAEGKEEGPVRSASAWEALMRVAMSSHAGVGERKVDVQGHTEEGTEGQEGEEPLMPLSTDGAAEGKWLVMNGGGSKHRREEQKIVPSAPLAGNGDGFWMEG